MLDALRYEWTRLTTLRSTYWLTGIGVLCALAIPVIAGIAVSDMPLDPESLATGLNGGAAFGIPFLAVFMAIIGIFATGHEYRHGTIQPTLTALPQRSRLILAKILVVSGVTVVVTVLSVALNALAMQLLWGDVPGLFEDPLRSALVGYLAYTLIYTLAGLGLGLLFRGVPSALVVIFLVPLIVENLIFGLSFLPSVDWLVPVVKFLPFSSGARLMAVDLSAMDMGPGMPDFDYFGRWGSGGVFAVFAALIIAAAWTLFKKRDA
ncbi:ABC transporter permease [Glycomyces harbinensis]|uniref:ABC-type transport system involved in multi-copper enzyme maturation, permease component n=1 Tax=Glycomyces harbinensis TaxID=58114 RepID=A0A1G6Z443_9ACTN|nr:ABC transporter permease [Glycomyces harbinensis]SDD96625.1 ABC-type transport system involved in multi-copper enzyme maturation, permease component [Glycomyces harbinensis]